MKKDGKKRYLKLALWMLVFAILLIPMRAEAAQASNEVTSQTEESSSAAVSEVTKPAASKVTGTKLVATGKLRINWTRSKGADGYRVYRRVKGSKKWTRIATIENEKQLYCYDGKVSAKKTYYYAVKPYVKSEGKTIYASSDKTGKKAYYKSVTVKPKKGDFGKGSVYGPYLSAKQLAQVKKAVSRFHEKYITSDMNSVEKVLVAQLYMARYCTYAPDYSKNGANSAWGSLVYKNSYGFHEAQCSGFARGFKALCDSMGVPCRYVHANRKSANPSHQWNEVKIAGKWYIVDPQCNATSGGLFFFLCSGKTYTSLSGMKWDKDEYPKVASRDYPYSKIEKAANGYKVQRVYQKLFQ